jgi:hypothetical protein
MAMPTCINLIHLYFVCCRKLMHITHKPIVQDNFCTIYKFILIIGFVPFNLILICHILFNLMIKINLCIIKDLSHLCTLDKLIWLVSLKYFDLKLYFSGIICFVIFILCKSSIQFSSYLKLFSVLKYVLIS